MTELLTCPFCGGGCLYETRRNGYCDETPTMFCNSCKAVVTWEQVEEEGVNDETKALVREHWNSRAERTCKQEERGWGTEGDHARVWLTCGHDCMVPTVQDLPNYCPNCRARVRSE